MLITLGLRTLTGRLAVGTARNVALTKVFITGSFGLRQAAPGPAAMHIDGLELIP